MKTILTEYLGVIIAVIIGITVISLIFFLPEQNTEVLGIAHKVMEALTGEELQVYEYERYDSFLQQEQLQISYVEEKPIYADTFVKLLEHFSVTDEDGNSVSYQVCDVYDKDGNSCYNQVISPLGNLHFELPGVYQILIKTQGENCKNVSALIAFPVKENAERSGE